MCRYERLVVKKNERFHPCHEIGETPDAKATIVVINAQRKVKRNHIPTPNEIAVPCSRVYEDANKVKRIYHNKISAVEEK